MPGASAVAHANPAWPGGPTTLPEDHAACVSLFSNVSELVHDCCPVHEQSHRAADTSYTAHARCWDYPGDTRSNLSALPRSLPHPPCLALESILIGDFYRFAWPELERRAQPYVLVTAVQDNSAPWEAFSCLGGMPGRVGALMHNVSALTKAAHANAAGVLVQRAVGGALRTFLRSPLLLRWYTQNYDLLPSAGKRVGYSVRDMGETACSERIGRRASYDSDFDGTRDAELIAKVSHLPIGLQAPCSQLPLWRRVVADVPALSTRKLSILVTFTKSVMRDRRKTALRELGSSAHTVIGHLSKEAFWRAISQYAFVAAPASRGQDTYRFWESVALGAIPVVQAGPLEGFYRHLPVVSVADWQNMTAPRLAEWRARIVATFGEYPHRHPQVARLLSSRYYAARIRSAEPVLPVLDGGGVDRVGDLTGIVAHTCNLTAGGLLAGESRGFPPLNCYGSVR